MEYLKKPHIPARRVTRVIAGGGISAESIRTLNALGIEVIPAYESENLLPPVSAHADMTILHSGGNKFVCSPDSYEYYKARLAGAKIIRGSAKLMREYPYDIAYNITLLNGFVFLNNSTVQPEIARAHIGADVKPIHVKQGYTKCNICIVSENALITSDTGIHRAAEQNGFDALLIQPGHIDLPGMDCGFIGGASGLIAPDTLAVNGNISTHPNAAEITEFCREHGVEILPLKHGTAEDIGSILPIA